MADTDDDAAEAVQRLEAALERIAVLARRRSAARFADVDKAELAARLDALIEQLRAALDGAAEPTNTENR